MEISQNELYSLLKKAAKAGAVEALKESNLLKKTITRAEVIALYGVTMFNNSIHYVKWQKKGAGKTSKVYADKNEFENFLNRLNVELRPNNYEKR
jgi:hypothetical protein